MRIKKDTCIQWVGALLLSMVLAIGCPLSATGRFDVYDPDDDPCWHLLVGGDDAPLDLFVAENTSDSRTTYQLNYDEAMEQLVSYGPKYKNQLSIRTAYHYAGFDSYRVDIPSPSGDSVPTVFISAGMHGNESVAVAALIEWIEEIIYDWDLRLRFNFIIYPNLNAWGLANNSRYLPDGTDGNRTFHPGKEVRFTRLVMESLKHDRADLGLDMHELFARTGYMSIRAQTNDDAYLEKVMADLDPQYLVQSPTGEYPGHLKKIFDPSKIGYLIPAVGVAQSFNKGTFKDFLKSELGAVYAYSLESTNKIPLALRLQLYKKYLNSHIRNFELPADQ